MHRHLNRHSSRNTMLSTPGAIENCVSPRTPICSKGPRFDIWSLVRCEALCSAASSETSPSQVKASRKIAEFDIVMILSTVTTPHVIESSKKDPLDDAQLAPYTCSRHGPGMKLRNRLSSEGLRGPPKSMRFLITPMGSNNFKNGLCSIQKCFPRQRETL